MYIYLSFSPLYLRQYILKTESIIEERKKNIREIQIISAIIQFYIALDAKIAIPPEHFNN